MVGRSAQKFDTPVVNSVKALDSNSRDFVGSIPTWGTNLISMLIAYGIDRRACYGPDVQNGIVGAALGFNIVE